MVRIISILIQLIAWIGSTIFLLIGEIKGGADANRMIFYAWLAITTQANLNFFVIDERGKNR